MNYRPVVTIGPKLTPMVKYLIIVTAAVFLLQQGAGREMTYIFGLTPALVLGKLFVWQLGTYLFLHGDFFHVLLNMFVLWMFGCEMERYLGSKRFLRFYFITGIGAGFLSLLAHPFSTVPTIGASGSIYGILMAYGLLFPDRLVYLYFLFPVRVKYFVTFLGAMAFLAALSSSGSGVDHFAHLGGMVFAFLYLKGWLSVASVRRVYHRWRMNRLRRRFKVYEQEKRKREDDFWIN